MKSNICVLFLFVVLLLLSPCLLQASVPDSAVYKIGKYDIKKQEKVFVVAQKLNVDPELIVKLNKLRNIRQDLVVGQRIKIPVYPKGYRYQPETVVIHKSIDLDSSKLALLYSDVEKNFLPPKPEKFFDPEEDRTRMMMVEATIDLNEAMLQGLQASFDSLNIIDNSPIDEKNVQAVLRRMKRSREKALLTPYLENVRDSLTRDLEALKVEQAELNARLNPAPQPVVKIDTVVKETDTIVYATKTFPDNRPEEKIITAIYVQDDVPKDDYTKIEVKRNDVKSKKAKQYFAVDTVIVYDLPSTTAKLKPQPELNPIKQPERVKGNWDTARAIDPLKPKGEYWDTAHAIAPAKDSSAIKPKPVDVRKDTTISLKIKLPNSTDSIVVKPIVVKKPDVPKPVDTTNTSIASSKVSAIVEPTRIPTPDTLLTTRANENPTSRPEADTVLKKTDTTKMEMVAASFAKDTSSKPVEVKTERKRESVGDAILAGYDSIKRIKAEFFYKRSQKSMAEKNFRNAEQYLRKSVELSPRYFEAWFALAELDAMFGSQQAALKGYQTCAQIDSTNPKLYVSIGNLLVKMKRKTDAYINYNKALEYNSNHAQALLARAAILNDWKKYNEAIADYDRVLILNRSNHFAYKARGQVKLLNKDFAGAIDDFTRFLIFEESDPSAYYYRGLAKIAHNELLDGCMDLSTSAGMGYPAAAKAIKKSCE